VKPEERHPKYGEFLYACCASTSKAEYLLRTHPELLEIRDGVGETPLHYLAIEDRCEAVSFLIKCGAQVNTCCSSEATPLMHAAGLGLKDMVAILLAASADPNARNLLYGSALHHAATAKANSVEIATLLLNGGAEIELPDDSENTPLMAAAKEGNAGVVQLLLARGADPNARNRYGDSVLHVAAFSMHCGAEAIELLLSEGANPRATDEDSETPYQIAVARGNMEVADALGRATGE
jgi:ankyrin repeat protein